MDIESNNESFVGNDLAPGATQDLDGNSAEQNVNPGAIRKSTTNSILNALSNASGQNFESVEAALSFMARTSAQQTTGGNAQPVEPQQTERRSNRLTTNDLHEQFNRLQQDLSIKEQKLREKELDSDIQRAMGERFDPDLLDYALTKVKSNIEWYDDGTYAITDNRGRERYGMDGSPLTIAGLVEEVATGNPKLLRQSNNSGGSGMRPGQGSFAGALEEGIPDYTRDPAAFNAWAARNGLGKNVGLKGMKVSASASTATRKIL
jgi:hypothetical protein